MKTAYFDCSSGISGDMCLGALVSAGASMRSLRAGLGKLPLSGYTLSGRRVMRAYISATKVDVKLRGKEGPTRRWKDVRSLIRRSSFDKELKERGLAIFESIFRAEAEVHAEDLDRVHLHELGATDAMVDVMGTLVCLDALGIERVLASPVNLGGPGTVRAGHGSIPLPAPATSLLLRGAQVYSSSSGTELTTPTGAAILKGICEGYGPMPPMVLGTVGTGAGDMDPKDSPNVLRVFVGEGPSAHGGQEAVLIETNIDDMDPRIYGHLTELLLEEGALDVYLTPVIMKKGRPGVKLTVLCTEDTRGRLATLVFKETTTLGLRLSTVSRAVLKRGIRKVRTPYGLIRVKEAWLGPEKLGETAEYEDCRKAAKRAGVPLREVMAWVGRGK